MEHDEYDPYVPQSIVQDKSHPNHWHNRANDLHASAGAIWLSMSGGRSKESADSLGLGNGFDMHLACFPVYHMLCGLSLEVLMKALLVKRGESPPEHHDLNLLAHLLGVKRTPPQKQILNFYQASVQWAGRYPVPLKADDQMLLDYWDMANNLLFKGKAISKGSFIKKYTPTHATAWERYNALYRSYSAMFDQLNLP